MANAEDISHRAARPSTLLRRSVTVLSRRTSVRLEPAMWRALREIAWREECRIHDLCSLIARRKHPDTNLIAAIRVFRMRYYRAAATEEGHCRAGHGSFSRLMERAGITQDMLAAGGSEGRTMRPSS